MDVEFNSNVHIGLADMFVFPQNQLDFKCYITCFLEPNFHFLNIKYTNNNYIDIQLSSLTKLKIRFHIRVHIIYIYIDK